MQGAISSGQGRPLGVGAISPGRAAAGGAPTAGLRKASELFKHSDPIYSCNEPVVVRLDPLSAFVFSFIGNGILMLYINAWIILRFGLSRLTCLVP